jgi:hypothetical protein
VSEFVITTSQKTPPDIEICELTATITDAGVAITAKSPLLGEYIATKINSKHRGEDYSASFKDLVFYSIPSRIALDIGGNGVFTDMFLSGRGIDGERGGEPNMLWMRTRGLAEGVTLTFPQPAHVPADLIEYLNRSMERLRTFYLKHVRAAVIKSSLTERFDG